MNETEPKKPKKTVSCFTFIAILVGVFFTVNLLSVFFVKMNMMNEIPKNIYKVDDIDKMKRVATFRLFADNYQFYIVDPDRSGSASSMFGAVMQLTQADSERSWTRTDPSITIFTFEDCNDHRVDIFVGKEYDGHGDAQRVFVFPLRLSKGQMDITDGMGPTENRIQVPSGEYAVYVRSFNLGKGIEDFIEKNEDFLARDDMERYEIVLVPGKPDQEGVIFGPEKRSDVEREIYHPHPNPPPQAGEGNAK